MEIELQHFHPHPLTVCDNENEGHPPRCPVCEYRYCFDGYNCSNCKFLPEKCLACDGKPSGSFYICKLCLPDSPFFHKSCAQLPQQIQIALRPHCILHLVTTSSDMSSFLSNIAFDCDFCNQSHKGYKFFCDLCNFQICSPCAAALTKHHQDRQHIQHFRHHHPLVLSEMEVKDTACQMCAANIHGESYCCAPCKFYIHKPCGELPQEVRHPFHPPHSLTLQQNTNLEWYRCDACRFYIDIGLRYRCDDCDFNLHTECVSLKPNIKYGGHLHLLNLVENMSYLSQCQACGCEIEDTFFVRCVECRLDFHVRCGTPALLPPSIVYQHHGHPLILTTGTLIKDDSVLLICDACKEEIKPNHPYYSCIDCRYYAHLRCVITEMQLDQKETIKHFSHNCSLFLLESNRNDDINCYACKKLIQAHPAYGCVGCKFYVHRSCFELPKVILHISHSHYLTLRDSFNSEEGICNACFTDLDGLIYRCDMCDFDLDLDCASQHPSIKWKASSDECKYHGDREGIGHYSHYHHLTLLEVDDMECKLCCKNIKGLSYGCAQCMFYVHKSCGELPQEVRHHAFHPRHSLTLQENTVSNKYNCDACRFGVDSGIRYRCDDCDFDLHIECVSLKPNIKYGGHQHLVILVENMSNIGKCQACRSEIEGTFFVRCVECRLNFHVYCGPYSLPPTVQHPHHDHPLTLTTETFVKGDSILQYCGVCKEERNPNHPSFYCVECEYYAHVRCVVTEVLFDKRGEVEHFSHDHILFLVGNERDEDLLCYACEKLIQAHPAYGCDQCRFYLHKSCVELPRQIQHLFHRHPLALKSHPDKGTKYHQCGSCNKNLCGFFYQCDSCFVIDVDCASLSLGVKFEGAEHILALFEKLQHTPECRKYIYANTGALNQSCVKCNFIVYLFRSPLPQTIECGSHRHPLTLTDNLDDDNYGTQICDVCEEERDPQLCVYYCAECDFVAEFFCVISEVILSLQNKPQDVPLRCIRRETAVKVTITRLTLKDIASFTDEEDQKWADLQQAFYEEKEEICKKFSGAVHEAKVGTSGKFVYSDHENFLQYLAVVSDDDRVILLEDEDYKCEVIEVGDYKTIPKLAGVLKKLLDKYGDIGASCSLPQRRSNLKAFLMISFCATVHSMCNTMIKDVNNPLLYTWWRLFNFAYQTGFKVEFFFDHLKKIAQACHQIDTDLPQISHIHHQYEEMEKLSIVIDGLDKEIVKQKGKMDALRKQTQDEISNISYQKLRLEAERLTEAREFRLMKAGTYTELL